MLSFERGDQIVYVPTHANGDQDHADCEYGFVTSVSSNGTVFCRFWHKGQPGVLRTVSNSEGTTGINLFKATSVRQRVVDCLLFRFYG